MIKKYIEVLQHFQKDINYDYNKQKNCSVFFENRKKYYLKNYMNKNDFFFSKL